LLIASNFLIRIEKTGENMAKPTPEQIKRNNRKIHARKFMATPEGKEWLAKKLIEKEEMKLVRSANKHF